MRADDGNEPSEHEQQTLEHLRKAEELKVSLAEYALCRMRYNAYAAKLTPSSRSGVQWPNAMLLGSAQKEFSDRYALIGVPHMWLLDTGGLLSVEGQRRLNGLTLEPEIQGHLNEARPLRKQSSSEGVIYMCCSTSSPSSARDRSICELRGC